jgi:signal transduction histidine kinase
MFRSPWRILLVLASVVFVALFSGLSLKQALISDFQHALGAERLDRDLFISRFGNIVLLWSFLTTGLALALGVLISRKTEKMVNPPVQATASDGSADGNKPVPVSEKIEISDLPGTGSPETEKNTKSLESPAVSMAASNEEEAEALLDDALNAGDEDMQPHAGGADRLTMIVKGLDELARAQALGRALQKRPIELTPYLSNIIENTRASAQDKEIAFKLECEDTLRLAIDPACLEKIMANLLDNAVKAVKKEGTVTVSAASRGDHVIIAVRDTGSGISRKALPHIYERFYRGSGKGIGLGLTIVQELVRACEGSIEVETAQGKGSVFTVSVPSLQQELF